VAVQSTYPDLKMGDTGSVSEEVIIESIRGRIICSPYARLDRTIIYFVLICQVLKDSCSISHLDNQGCST
jgi:hypothetical protein